MPLVPRFCSQCGAALVESVVDERTREVCPACSTVFYRNPLPVAAALALNEKREVLLVKRRHPPLPGRWCLPMGFAELGETIAEAALRELHEEAGIDGRIIRLLDVHSYNSDFYGDLLIVTFEVEKIGGTEAAGDDAEETSYFSIEGLPQLAFPANQRAVEACRESYREEWAIRDSFETLRAEGTAEMLSDALVGVIRDHAGEIADRWLTEVQSNPTTPSYRHADPVELQRNAVRALSQFSQWLRGDSAEEEIRTFYRAIGAQRRADSFGLHEVLSSLMLLRKQVWMHARQHGLWRRALEVYRVLELDRRLVLFFDRAMYHTAKGYEEAA